MLAAAEDDNGEGVAADLLRRSGRDLCKSRHPLSDPSDMKLLREALSELKRVWSGREPSGSWQLVHDASDVPGLLVCESFLSEAEVEALRTVMGAHRAWVHYAYGSTGRHNELASVVQRIDFGPPTLRPEGVTDDSPMWRLGSLRAELVSMMGERLQHVCKTARLWEGLMPDTMQLTKIGSAQMLANHVNRRDRWQDGIATIAWSELPSETDLRGDEWLLVMERGPKKDQEQKTLTMPPGSAFVLTGRAQGSTTVCLKRCVGHARCACCWTHGVRVSKESIAAQQSLTLRVLADSDDEDSDRGEDDVEDEQDDGVAENE